MKKFSYALQKILDLRNFELDQAKAELGKVNALIAEQNRILQDIANNRHIVMTETDSSLHDVYYLSSVQNYFTLLDNQKEQCLYELSKLEMEADEKREVVRKAMQKVKALEKNRERKMDAWKLENAHEAEIVLDDIVSSHAKK